MTILLQFPLQFYWLLKLQFHYNDDPQFYYNSITILFYYNSIHNAVIEGVWYYTH